jgi:predicted DNA-binding transcriptional regulator
MTDKEREALQEFENELLDSLKELRKKIKNYKSEK